ncbi:hypothetical protein GEMRC1_011674 [Eukaryota sp. GEM-RC1]
MENSAVDPLFLGMLRYRHQKFDSSIDSCSLLLQRNPRDQAAWFLKCKSLVSKNYLDTMDMDDDGIADLLLDSNATSDAPRPGTSFSRPTTTSANSSRSSRPMTGTGRPVTGFVRPGTSRPTTTSTARTMTAKQALTSRPGTSKPVTQAGRLVRLGTASVFSAGKFIDSEHLNYPKYLSHPSLAKVLVDYLLIVEHLPGRAQELCNVFLEDSTRKAFKDEWFWSYKLGRCFYQLGLFKDAETRYLTSLRKQEMMTCLLDLSLVYLKLDVPNTALNLLNSFSQRYSKSVPCLIQIARIHDQLNNLDKSTPIYRNILKIDPSNIEATACLAVGSFYDDQPETALRLYKRLLDFGVFSTELWSNLGISAFYSGQYDIALNCLLRSLNGNADDEILSEVWYNISHVAIAVGDMTVAFQSLKLALSFNPNHIEALTNLSYIEMKQESLEEARSSLKHACSLGPQNFEPYYAYALLHTKNGDFQQAFKYIMLAFEYNPLDADVISMKEQLEQHFYGL